MIILSFDVGIINLAYVVFDSVLKKILHWEVISLDTTNNYNDLYINLIKALDNRKHLVEGVDTVLIEKQPSFNPKMRIISGCLQSYFYIRGVVDRSLLGLPVIKNIRFFSPKHKLKCHTSGEELVITGKCKSKYLQTKKMGILIARSKLTEYSETPEIKQQFEQSKKKDDLADCYLQAITFSMFGNPSKVTKPKVTKVPKPIKTQLKAQISEYLDKHIHVGELDNVIDCYQIINKFDSMKIIIQFLGTDSTKESLSNEQISELLTKLNMKRYLKLKYLDMKNT